MTWAETLVNTKIRGSFSDQDYIRAGSLRDDPVAEKGRKLLGPSFRYRLHSKWDRLGDKFFKAVRDNNIEDCFSILAEIDQLTIEDNERDVCVLTECEFKIVHVSFVFIEPEGSYVSDRVQTDIKWWEIKHRDDKHLGVPEPHIPAYHGGSTASQQRVALNKSLVDQGFPPLSNTWDIGPEESSDERRRKYEEEEAKRKEREANHIPLEMLKVGQAMKLMPSEDESFDQLANRVRASVSNFSREHVLWTLVTRSFPEENAIRVYRSK